MKPVYYRQRTDILLSVILLTSVTNPARNFPFEILEQLLGKTIIQKDTFAEKTRIKILQGMAKSEDTPNRYAIRALEQLDEMNLPE